MKISISLPYYEAAGFDRDRILSWAKKIDQGPFHSLVSSERVTGGACYDMQTLLTAAAAVTERVRIFPALYVLPMRSEVITAREIATLDIIADGRLAVTVGVGGRPDDYRAAGASFERRHERLDAQVAQMRSLWRGEPLFEGSGEITPRSPQGDGIPIYSGAMGPKAIARAAKWADGVYGASVTGDREGHERMFDLARAAWKAEGRADPPYLIGAMWYSLAPDGEERLRGYAYSYMRGRNEELARSRAAAMTGYTPENVRAGIENVRAAGADEVIMIPVTPHEDEVDRLISLLR